MDKRNLFLRSLYDFANSFVFINFILYFSQWLVINWGLSDFRYNATFAIATIILLFSAPKLASYTDKWWRKKLFLTLATIGTAISYLLSAVFAYLGASIYIITSFFILGSYFYQLCFVFHNPLIEDVADTKHRSRASGICQGANSLGCIVGLLMSLPLITTSRLAPLIPSVAIFIVLALPMLIRFKESKRPHSPDITNELWVLPKKKLILFFTTSAAIPILTSLFFFNDAYLTFTNNYGIFLEKIFGTVDSTKSILLMLVLVTAVIGALIGWWIGDRIGQLKTYKGILVIRIIILLLISIALNFTLFAALAVASGFLMGAVPAVTRWYLSNILKKEELSYGFAFYTVTERFATFLWPLVWGGIVWLYGQSALWYRYATLAMAIFIIISLVIIIVKKPKHAII